MKKPIIVYFLALAFMVSPFISFWLSVRGLGGSTSYSTLELLKATHPLDATINALIFLAGALLIKPHKLTWSFAIFCLILVTVFNVYLLAETDFSAGGAFGQQLWMSLLATLSGGVVMFFFRFPYLDRRDTWTGTAKRFNVNLPVEIKGHGMHKIGSVSATGVRVDLAAPLKIQKDFILSLKFDEAGEEPLLGRVVDYDGNLTLRVEFQSSSDIFQTWVKTLKPEPKA